MTDLKNIVSNNYRKTRFFYVLLYKVDCSDALKVDVRYANSIDEAWSQVSDCYERLGSKEHENPWPKESTPPCLMKVRILQEQCVMDCLIKLDGK